MQKDKTQYKILLIEDNPGDIALIEDYVEEYLLAPELTVANTYKEATGFLTGDKEFWDIILLDLSLPDKSGEDLILQILDKASNIPVVVLTGYTDVEFSIKSLKHGVSDYLIKDALNAFSLYKSILHNIGRKKFILKLQKSEKRYNDLFHFSPHPMWVFDSENFNILDVNKSALEKYQFELEEFTKKKIDDLIPEEIRDKSMELFKQLSNNFSGYLCDLIHHTKFNKKINVEIHLSPIQFSNKEAYIMQANDISDRLQYIADIEKQNERLSKISWIQSHVVRAPLVRMQGLIEILQMVDNTEERDFCLEQIVQSAGELDSIIRDISDKARTINYDIK